MEDLKSFMSAVAQIAEEKGISKDKVRETIETAIAAAYKKDYGKKGQIIEAKLDLQTGGIKFWRLKLVISEDMILSEEEIEELKEKKIQENLEEGEKKVRFNPERHIMEEEARKIEKDIKTGEYLKIDLEDQKDYGRIAAQTAKQVILQRIREAEREAVLEEYKKKQGEIISGIVQRVESRRVFFDIGKTLGVLPREEQVPGEFYRPGQRLKVYVMKIEEVPKGPVILLSRIYPKLISKLFELEVPEVSSEQVLIKSIAREAGSRSKIAVTSNMEGVDPIGAMVGQRGTRVGAVISELGGEKIDIIEYSEDPGEYISNSLSPAKVLDVKILPKNQAIAVVPHDQLSLAIGRDGQNVRLAAKLTGWKIDIKSQEDIDEEKAGETGKVVEETEQKEKKEKEESSSAKAAADDEEKKEQQKKEIKKPKKEKTKKASKDKKDKKVKKTKKKEDKKKKDDAGEEGDEEPKEEKPAEKI